jgi:hypothetical protein
VWFVFGLILGVIGVALYLVAHFTSKAKYTHIPSRVRGTPSWLGSHGGISGTPALRSSPRFSGARASRGQGLQAVGVVRRALLYVSSAPNGGAAAAVSASVPIQCSGRNLS